MTEHLTELALELARTGEATDAEAAHLAGCAECGERLRRHVDLTSAYRSVAVPVPSERDASISRMISAEADRIRRAAGPARRGRWIFAGIAAAAAAAMFVIAFPKALGPRESVTVAAGPDDINRDGRVDILDAFQLSRRLEQGGGTGGYDADDVDRIATLAVSLRGNGR